MGELNKRGALWKKTGRNGSSFLSGEIETPDGEKLKVVIFENNNKRNDKQPDYKVFAEY